MPISLEDFNYVLPEKLIAQTPAVPRDQSRLLVVNRQTETIVDSSFDQLPSWLNPGDLLVRNCSKVIPARLIGHKPSGGRMEVLLHQLVQSDPTTQSWSCLCRSGVKQPTTITFAPTFSGLLLPAADRQAHMVISFPYPASQFWVLLNQFGQPPLPPYIHTRLAALPAHELTYQTYYAKHPGSVAAPTAGLHFSGRLDRALRQKKVSLAELTLHVGWGTFLPVKDQRIEDHQMHFEPFDLPASVVSKITLCHQNQTRVVAVGTTTTRVLETPPLLVPRSESTNLYIFPPRQFKLVDALITNFHLPHSTLLMLVSAFASFPNTNRRFVSFQQSLIGRAYRHAVKQGYRFFSYGDAMLIL